MVKLVQRILMALENMMGEAIMSGGIRWNAYSATRA